MNVATFAEEFTQLLIRWTKPNESNQGQLLTNQQILNVIRDTVQILLGVSLQVPDYSSVCTPAAQITICTPNAPTVPKHNLDIHNTSLGRFRSLDTLSSLSASNNVGNFDGDPMISKSQENIDIVKGEQSESTPEQKKFISRSSPAIHVNSVTRSDTFIREEEAKKASSGVTGKNESEGDEKSDTTVLDTEKMKSNSFVRKIDALRECACNVIAKIDEVKKDVFPERTKPIRRLSSVGSGRSSTLMRPIPSAKLRRSSAGFPGTPTSSKLNTTITTGKDDPVLAKRKNVAVSKISPLERTSSLAVPVNKKSPMSGGKPVKNPKYAHVQSTIPKVSVAKRKDQ